MSGDYRVMGVVNVTPDSFSDGGLFLDARAAIEHGLQLAQEGAHILDVGGESTRPGAEPVGVEEELRRVVPVLEGLVMRGIVGRVGRTHEADAQVPAHGSPATGVQLSIDTSKAVVARAAIGAGASLVNDVTAFRGDPDMAAVVAASGAECCLMHMLGEPRTMQADPRYEDVVDDVKAFLEERMAFAVAEGIPERRILLDPGIGFGKTLEHNLQLLRRLDELVALGRPVVIGTSRKSFLGHITAHAGANERLPGTIATNVLALERGARVFRVHDVRAVSDALAVASATLGRRCTASTSTPRNLTSAKTTSATRSN